MLQFPSLLKTANRIFGILSKKQLKALFHPLFNTQRWKEDAGKFWKHNHN
jgi:hypothetical protein